MKRLLPVLMGFAFLLLSSTEGWSLPPCPGSYNKTTWTIGNDRPDGLIVVQRGTYRWAAFVEAKIGGPTLEKEQIERYLRLARDNSVDALLTISNESPPPPFE